MMTAADPASTLLRQVPLFAELQPEILDLLVSESPIRRYPRGQFLFNEGDPGESLLVLEEGSVKIARFAASGQEVVLATTEAPAIFGELALLEGAPRSATVTARTPVVVRVLSRQEVLGLIEREPSVSMAMPRAMAAMVRVSNDRLTDAISLDVPGRIAKRLLSRAGSHGAPDPRGIVVPIGRSQGDLAAELGTTRVSVNRTIKSFEAQRIVTLNHANDTIVIHDLSMLEAHTR